MTKAKNETKVMYQILNIVNQSFGHIDEKSKEAKNIEKIIKHSLSKEFNKGYKYGQQCENDFNYSRTHLI